MPATRANPRRGASKAHLSILVIGIVGFAMLGLGAMMLGDDASLKLVRLVGGELDIPLISVQIERREPTIRVRVTHDGFHSTDNAVLIAHAVAKHLPAVLGDGARLDEVWVQKHKQPKLFLSLHYSDVEREQQLLEALAAFHRALQGAYPDAVFRVGLTHHLFEGGQVEVHVEQAPADATGLTGRISGLGAQHLSGYVRRLRLFQADASPIELRF